MRHNRFKDFNLRSVLKNNEFNLFILKPVLNNENLDYNLRFKFKIKMLKYLKNNFKSKISDRCVISHRNNSVLRDFRLERTHFTEFAKKGLSSGFKKSSW